MMKQHQLCQIYYNSKSNFIEYENLSVEEVMLSDLKAEIEAEDALKNTTT